LKFLKPRVGDSHGGAKLTAYTLLNGKVRTSLFNKILVETDIPRIVVGVSLVFVMMWLFTGSLFVTMLAFAQIGLSIAMAFGVYSVVLWLPFFPFINITGLFLCLGIGADDVFVMVQSFDDAIRARKMKTIDAHLVKEVLIDAGAATLVTSCTTAGAFFSSMSSSITAIKCFGVFCGLVVCCDWLTMIFFIPPVAVLYQRYVAPCCCRAPHRLERTIATAARCAATPPRPMADVAVGGGCLGLDGPSGVAK
jgi:predicted RND superfamily exporter protein